MSEILESLDPETGLMSTRFQLLDMGTNRALNDARLALEEHDAVGYLSALLRITTALDAMTDLVEQYESYWIWGIA